MLVANVGLGFLFLLAGYELELGHFRERSGRLAMAGWLVSAVVSIVVTGLLAAAGLVHAFVPVALALTTTALGTLLPILRDNDMLDGPLGRLIMPAGAVGEFFPIVGIAIFLGLQRSSVRAALARGDVRAGAGSGLAAAAGPPRAVRGDLPARASTRRRRPPCG